MNVVDAIINSVLLLSCYKRRLSQPVYFWNALILIAGFHHPMEGRRAHASIIRSRRSDIIFVVSWHGATDADALRLLFDPSNFFHTSSSYSH